MCQDKSQDRTITFYDVTLPISGDTAVWPGDPPLAITRVSEPGQPSVSQLNLGSHTGTHVDPPAHFIPAAPAIDELPLDVLIGPAWLAHLPGPGPLHAAALAAAGIPPAVRRLLLRTCNSERTGRVAAASAAFDPEFVALAEDAAAWLLAAGIRLVGIDGPSIEPYVLPGEPVHRLLLGAGVVVVENLVLSGLAPGTYQLYCLPLKVAGGDGAPARVILAADHSELKTQNSERQGVPP